jgi:phosphatidylethanolamine-binding protein (PEBP) family uncharacterized protein
VIVINYKNVQGYMRPTPLARTGTHRYVFELYALDTLIHENHRVGRDKIETVMSVHTIQKASLTGLYSR